MTIGSHAILVPEILHAETHFVYYRSDNVVKILILLFFHCEA